VEAIIQPEHYVLHEKSNPKGNHWGKMWRFEELRCHFRKVHQRQSSRLRCHMFNNQGWYQVLHWHWWPESSRGEVTRYFS